MFEFCIPTRGTKGSTGPEWLHEIKMKDDASGKLSEMKGPIPVTVADRYREQAGACEAQAAKTNSESDKGAWLQLAADWLQLAEDAEK